MKPGAAETGEAQGVRHLRRVTFSQSNLEEKSPPLKAVEAFAERSFSETIPREAPPRLLVDMGRNHLQIIDLEILGVD